MGKEEAEKKMATLKDLMNELNKVRREYDQIMRTVKNHSHAQLLWFSLLYFHTEI